MKDKHNVKIFCRKNESDKLDFYLEVKREVIYLFSCDYYSHNIYTEYYNGKRLEEVFTNTSLTRQQKLKERIIRMVKYTSQEYQLAILGKSKKPVHKDITYDYDYEVA